MKKTLSIVIVNYNTKKLLDDCLNSIFKRVEGSSSLIVYVVDNGSTDGSVNMVRKKYPEVNLIVNENNLGFAKANNKARGEIKTKYVLFLNSDTVLHKDTLSETLKYMKSNKDVGSLSCKTVLKNGQLDKDVRRSFPTPWVALTHLVFRLDRIFPTSRLLSQYWYGYKDENETHEVDVIQGAFHLTRKKVLDQVGWFDEDYFLDGEDIDLCWRIKKAGWKIIYFPKVKVTHLKKASKNRPNKKERKNIVSTGVKSMEVFYRKRLWDTYPKILNYLVIFAVKSTMSYRLFKLSISK